MQLENKAKKVKKNSSGKLESCFTWSWKWQQSRVWKSVPSFSCLLILDFDISLAKFQFAIPLWDKIIIFPLLWGPQMLESSLIPSTLACFQPSNPSRPPASPYKLFCSWSWQVNPFSPADKTQNRSFKALIIVFGPRHWEPNGCQRKWCLLIVGPFHYFLLFALG